MLGVLDELPSVRRNARAAASERAAASSGYEHDVSVMMNIIWDACGKANQAVLQAGRHDNSRDNPVEALAEYRAELAERRLQMEGDLDQQNGAMVAVVMLADYGPKKAGEAGFVPESELGCVPCRRLTDEEIANWEDPCLVPVVGDELRIAGLLHGVK